MIDLTQLFDPYSRQARLYPALLTLAPLIAVALSIWPTLGGSAWAGTLAALAAGLGVLFLLTEIARSRGKRLEPILLTEWGGWPTTIWLRHSSGLFSANTLAGIVRPNAPLVRRWELGQGICLALSDQMHLSLGGGS